MKTVRTVLLIVVVIAVLWFIGMTLKRAAPTKAVAQAPAVPSSPNRVYGQVEPAGGEVPILPPVTRQVAATYVREGDRVVKGQRLCLLEGSVENAELNSALGRVDVARRALALSRDVFQRNQGLHSTNSISEFEFTQSRLKYELDSATMVSAGKDAEAAKATANQLLLTAPCEGKVYKFDVRTGQTLTTIETPRIVLGSALPQVRLFVEAFWMGSVKPGMRYRVFDAETDEPVGTGTATEVVPYMDRRVFRTEDVQERFDTKFRQVILSLATDRQNLPLGLYVVAVQDTD
jgi:multidrug efflux pump subunit AcrA (membrane-fusion protein)